MSSRNVMKQVTDAVGDVLGEQGLKAVYVATRDPGSEDDSVAFVDEAGRASVVSLQVDSMRPSVAGASVNVEIVERTQIAEGWEYVACTGFMSGDTARGAGESLRKLREALIENEGLTAAPDSPTEGILVHPRTAEAWAVASKAAGEAGMTAKPFVTGDVEGIVIEDGSGAVGRVEVLAGRYEVIVRGEKETVNFQAADCAARLEDVLNTGLSEGFRPGL